MLRIKAPAKINLSLSILGKQEKFHEVKMVMTSLDLADYVTISKAPSHSKTIAVTSDCTMVPINKDNIAYQAAYAFMGHFNLTGDIKINIEKNIPIAGGLAGGSSNAAAVLKGMRELFNIDCSTSELCDIGGTIGSDVPFCIIGKTALATGRGEIITPIKSAPPCWVIIVNPRVSVSTHEIYSDFKLEDAETIDVNAMLEAIENQDFNAICKNLANNLEPITIAKVPKIKAIKDKLSSLGANGVLMSGSGATVFALIYTEKKATAIYQQMKSIYPQYTIHLTRILG